MRGTRAKQIRRASGMRLKLYRAVRAAAMADGKPEEIYMGVPNGTRLWDGKGGRLQGVGKDLYARRQSGTHRKHTPPALLVSDDDTGLFSFYLATPMFALRCLPDLPQRTVRNSKRLYKKLVRDGKRNEALQALKHLETRYPLTPS